jgi:hypothetical protein
MSDNFTLGVAFGLFEFFEDELVEGFKKEFYEHFTQLLNDAEDCESYPPLYYRQSTRTNCKTEASAKSSDCPVCQGRFASYKGMMQHRSKTHDKQVKHVQCEVCPKRFKHKYALKFHVRQVHERVTRKQCTICTKELYNKYTYRSHMEQVHPDANLNDE